MARQHVGHLRHAGQAARGGERCGSIGDGQCFRIGGALVPGVEQQAGPGQPIARVLRRVAAVQDVAVLVADFPTPGIQVGQKVGGLGSDAPSGEAAQIGEQALGWHELVGHHVDTGERVPVLQRDFGAALRGEDRRCEKDRLPGTQFQGSVLAHQPTGHRHAVADAEGDHRLVRIAQAQRVVARRQFSDLQHVAGGPHRRGSISNEGAAAQFKQ